MNKLAVSAGAALLSAGATLGAFELDRHFSNDVNDQMVECQKTFDGQDQSICIEQVQNNSSSYGLIQIAEIIGLVGMAGFGYRAYEELKKD